MIKMQSSKNNSGATKKKTNPRTKLVAQKRSATVVRANESQKTSATKPSTSTPIDENQKQAASILKGNQNQPATSEANLIPLHYLHHQELVNDHFLSESRTSRDIRDKLWRENHLRLAGIGLQAKIKHKRGELANVGRNRNFFQQAVGYAEEKMRKCEELENNFSEELMMTDALIEKRENIKEILDQIQKVRNEAVNEDKLFQEQNQAAKRKLDEVNRDYEFAIKSRDDARIQIDVMDKILSKINLMVDDTRKTNSQLAKEICAVQRKFEDKELQNSMTFITDNARKQIQEKTELVRELREERVQMEKERERINSAYISLKSETEIVCAHVNELKIESDKMEKLVSRIQNANKNLREEYDAKVEGSEFNQRRLVLLEKIEKTTAHTIALKEKTKKRQNQYNELKQMKAEISKKKERREELRRILEKMEDQKRKQEHEKSMLVANNFQNITSLFTDSSLEESFSQCDFSSFFND